MTEPKKTYENLIGKIEVFSLDIRKVDILFTMDPQVEKYLLDHYDEIVLSSVKNHIIAATHLLAVEEPHRMDPVETYEKSISPTLKAALRFVHESTGAYIPGAVAENHGPADLMFLTNIFNNSRRGESVETALGKLRIKPDPVTREQLQGKQFHIPYNPYYSVRGNGFLGILALEHLSRPRYSKFEDCLSERKKGICRGLIGKEDLPLDYQDYRRLFHPRRVILPSKATADWPREHYREMFEIVRARILRNRDHQMTSNVLGCFLLSSDIPLSEVLRKPLGSGGAVVANYLASIHARPDTIREAAIGGNFAYLDRIRQYPSILETRADRAKSKAMAQAMTNFISQAYGLTPHARGLTLSP